MPRGPRSVREEIQKTGVQDHGNYKVVSTGRASTKKRVKGSYLANENVWKVLSQPWSAWPRSALPRGIISIDLLEDIVFAGV